MNEYEKTLIKLDEVVKFLTPREIASYLVNNYELVAHDIADCINLETMLNEDEYLDRFELS